MSIRMTLAAVAAVVTTLAVPLLMQTTPAAAQDGAFCAITETNGTPDCSFASFAQCRATITGDDGVCQANSRTEIPAEQSRAQSRAGDLNARASATPADAGTTATVGRGQNDVYRGDKYLGADPDKQVRSKMQQDIWVR